MIEVVDDPPSERAAKRFLKGARSKVDEILRLRATADQLAGELAAELSRRAPELSNDLSYEDCAVLLRALASVV